MNESRRKAMRAAHAKHKHTCTCGRVVYGNGGWASHAWSCADYQTKFHARLDRYKHNPKRCETCKAAA